MTIRLRYRRAGGHVHCRVFTAKSTEMTFAKCGDLVFSVEEWPAVLARLAIVIQVLPEEE